MLVLQSVLFVCDLFIKRNTELVVSNVSSYRVHLDVVIHVGEANGPVGLLRHPGTQLREKSSLNSSRQTFEPKIAL